jgi:hypothetical protein
MWRAEYGPPAGPEGPKLELGAPPDSGASRGTAGPGQSVPQGSESPSLAPVGPVRKFFPETWIWTERKNIGY